MKKIIYSFSFTATMISFVVLCFPNHVIGQHVSNCFASDRAMGSTNRNDHYSWAQAQSASQLAANVKLKLNLFYNCPSADDYTLRASFANVSAIIGKSTQNSSCFANDPGAKNADVMAHYEWAKTKSRQQLLDNLQGKVAETFKCLSSQQQKTFFADLSVSIAQTASKLNTGNTVIQNGGNNQGNTETGEWKVWVKTSPCSGRNDWISVAKENPTGGGNFFYLADYIFPGTSCTSMGCSFAEATAIANKLRTSNEFFKYCCRDYSVWENIQTGKMSVVQGKFGTAGAGWRQVKTDLCYEEAQALATPDKYGDWKVWVRTSPCSGRYDWISVARENPTAGGNFFYLADYLFPGTSCTAKGCTFQEATAVANTLRTSNEFFKYCCRDYSVWENIQTGKMSVVQGKFGTAGSGWRQVKTDLCYDEAQALATADQFGDWKVWVKTSPCSGRYDWVTVARENPTGGQNFFYLANFIIPGTGCTTTGCTFQQAMTVANSVRTSPQFSNYCCRDYSVWEYTQTGKMTIVKGKFGTAGFGWRNVKSDLCCEEAEALAGIPGACSGTDQSIVNNTKCWPGSYAAINPQTKKVDCYCYPGLVWNNTKTACIKPEVLVKEADCSKFPGSYAAWDPTTQTVRCLCPEGKKWNSTMTACIDDPGTATCWPGSHAVINQQTQKVECFCDPGLVWNSTKTACVKPEVLVAEADCSKYPGSYAAWDPNTQTVRCLCPEGKKWNSTMTACIDATTTTTTTTTNQGGGTGNWTLVSVTADPEDPNKIWRNHEWTYSAPSPSAQYSLYNGTYKVNYSWTPPPQQFNSNGFTVSMNVNCTATGGQSISGIIGVTGSGLTSDVEDKTAYAKGEGSAAASKSVNFKPSSNYADIEVKVSFGWSVVYIYKYKRAQ